MPHVTHEKWDSPTDECEESHVMAQGGMWQQFAQHLRDHRSVQQQEWNSPPSAKCQHPDGAMHFCHIEVDGFNAREPLALLVARSVFQHGQA